MKKFLGLLKDIVICFVIAFLINRFVFMFAFVPTGSMKPTIMEKDRIIVDRISLLFNEIKRGDIVVFESSATQEEKLLVKRVVGLPGETVEIKEGKVFINDVPFDEEYVYYPDNMSMEKIEISEDNYFMLGDNRNNSFDARFWENKTIEKKDIIGFARLFKKR